MTTEKGRITAEEAKGLRTAKELEGHLAWLDTFTPAALGVLAIASGIYTYLGVSSLLEDNGAVSFFAAVAYSIAVSVGIFVFWSYMLIRNEDISEAEKLDRLDEKIQKVAEIAIGRNDLYVPIKDWNVHTGIGIAMNVARRWGFTGPGHRRHESPIVVIYMRSEHGRR